MVFSYQIAYLVILQLPSHWYAKKVTRQTIEICQKSHIYLNWKICKTNLSLKQYFIQTWWQNCARPACMHYNHCVGPSVKPMCINSWSLSLFLLSEYSIWHWLLINLRSPWLIHFTTGIFCLFTPAFFYRKKKLYHRTFVKTSFSYIYRY